MHSERSFIWAAASPANYLNDTAGTLLEQELDFVGVLEALAIANSYDSMTKYVEKIRLNWNAPLYRNTGARLMVCDTHKKWSLREFQRVMTKMQETD